MKILEHLSTVDWITFLKSALLFYLLGVFVNYVIYFVFTKTDISSLSIEEQLKYREETEEFRQLIKTSFFLLFSIIVAVIIRMIIYPFGKDDEQ